jgi:outer membrane protein assembly factor BamB
MVWRQPIGLGWSSFAIAHGRAVTQEQRGENELVVCYDPFNGRALWAHTNKVRFSEPLGGDGPRATPTLVSNRVYALGATGILDCFALSDGTLVWSRDTLKEAGASNLVWGKSSSPLVFNDLVVVSGGDSGPLLLAFNKNTGALVWRGGNGSSSYASPVLANVGGRTQILSVNAQSVTGHDPEDGAVLWDYPWPGGFPKCSQPVAIGPDKVFISAGYGVGCALLQLKAQPDGRLETSEVWKNRNMKTQFANVAVRDGFIYGLDEGILACVELETGKRRWKDGRYGHGQMLLVEDVLLVQMESGPVALVEANPNAFHEIARTPALKSKTWNNPALTGKYLLVRNDQEAICFELRLRQ